MSKRNSKEAKARRRAGRADGDVIRDWLRDVRSMSPSEEADSCQVPGCDSGGVWIWVQGTAGGTLRATRNTLELIPHAREGVACGIHGRMILNRLPRDEIERVAVYVDPDDPEDCEPAEAEAVRAILRDWPDSTGPHKAS